MKKDDSLWAKATLEYTDQWFELGILTDEICQLQHLEWSKAGADKNTEHYRYGAWRAFWGAKESISDQDLAKCIALAESDSDPAMGGAILHDILKTSWLSDEQFQMVSSHADDPSASKVISRYSLFRSLKKDHSSDNLDRVVREGDSIAQRHVIDNYPLDRSTLEFLEEHGAVRAVRNLARQKLRKSRTSD